MNAPSASPPPLRRLRRSLLAVVLLVCALWFTFFDSHSLLQRIQWHREHARLTEQNAALRLEIERLEQRLEERNSEEVVEKIAREQYGMRRPGETVYRVEERAADN